MNQLYGVPVIPSNLQREETIIQIADVLNYLSQVTEDILKRVNDRIEVNNKHVKDITERINVASKKVGLLTGAKKATRVFSSSKYPAANGINRHYVSIFNKFEPLHINRHKVKSKIEPPVDKMLETLHFYHVKIRNNDKKYTKTGLGPIPTDINSVNDLLLFGTGKNPFKEYVMSDTLKIKQKLKENEHSDNTDIGAAPLSISDRTALTRSTTETYFYAPDIGDVPAIDVPLDLPDLPGIADDLRYVDESGPGIAPSVISTPNIPELPIVVDDEKQDEVNLETEIILPPPPPPPIEEVEKKQIPETTVSQPLETKKEITHEVQTTEIIESKIETPHKVVLNNDSARASLMEAIRKAGGSKNAKLRTTEQQNTSKTNSTGGDLMADLHSKLAMRRKGISGAKNEETNINDSSISAMDRISAMIPPPPQKNDLHESNTTEDEDWD